MGSNFSNLFGNQPKYNILILGLDNGGKTTLIYKIRANNIENKIPFIGINIEEAQYKNFNLKVIDLGGSSKLPKLVNTICENIDAIIYVIDSSDKDRLEFAYDTF